VLEQRSAGAMIMFENFKGMVREISLWQQMMELPFNVTKDLIKAAAASYIFNEANFFGGWDSKTKYGYK
jgi:hypothetical protein